MVAAIAEAYHWPLDYIMKLTMPRIIMLTHGAKSNHAKWESQHEHGDGPRVRVNNKSKKKEDPVINSSGDRLSSISGDFDRLVRYLAPLTSVDAMSQLAERGE